MFGSLEWLWLFVEVNIHEISLTYGYILMTTLVNKPKRSSSYIGRVTDTSRWDAFEARQDDIFICSPPKCGTTWVQAICLFLLIEKPSLDGKLADISPWFDCRLDNLSACLDRLSAQTHRRFIKTHSPLDGIPYFDNCTYLIVYRDPKDAYFSMRHHLMNIGFSQPLALPQLAENPREGFRAWCQLPFEPEKAEQRSLSSFAQHYQSYDKFKHLKNFHFLHYSDLIQRRTESVSCIASILGIELTDDRFEAICESVSFDKMKGIATFFTPTLGRLKYKKDDLFFNSGKNEQWRSILEGSNVEQYNQRINELLEPEQIQWIENGSGCSS